MTRVSGDYKVQKIIKRIHKLSRLCMIYISVTNNTVLLPFFCGCWSNLFATIYLWGFCYRRFIKRYLFNNKHRITYYVHKRARCFDNVLMHFFSFHFPCFIICYKQFCSNNRQMISWIIVFYENWLFYLLSTCVYIRLCQSFCICTYNL